MKIAALKTDKGVVHAVYDEERNTYFAIEGDMFGSFSVGKEVRGELVSPVSPSKIIALGANYRKHATELNLRINPVPTLFLKPVSALLSPFGEIVYPASATRVDYEAELAIVIGKRCHKVKRENAFDVILGYTCANDVSERIFQKIDGQWTRAKGYDTFCPLGPCVVTDVDVSALELRAVVNGVTVQRGNTSDMISSIPEIIEFVSEVMTLLPGDVILTGTPDGIGEIRVGDTVEIQIENIGRLINTVVAEKSEV